MHPASDVEAQQDLIPPNFHLQSEAQSVSAALAHSRGDATRPCPSLIGGIRRRMTASGPPGEHYQEPEVDVVELAVGTGL